MPRHNWPSSRCDVHLSRDLQMQLKEDPKWPFHEYVWENLAPNALDGLTPSMVRLELLNVAWTKNQQINVSMANASCRKYADADAAPY